MSQKKEKIQWDTQELVRFHQFLEEELERLENRAADRVISRAYGGNMPRKEEASRFRKTEEYKKLVKKGGQKDRYGEDPAGPERPLCPGGDGLQRPLRCRL